MRPLSDLSDRSRSQHILVLGDAMLDRYTWGDAERVSPEAPVLVLRASDREVRPGGATSVAFLLRALGAEVTLAGVVGNDADGRTLRTVLVEAGICDDLVLADPERPTTVKERFLGRTSHRQAQQILRVDHELRAPIATDVEHALASVVIASLSRADILLISDYAKGVCTPALLEAVIAEARAKQVPVAVDPARLRDYERYRGAQLVTPNRIEAELASGEKVATPLDARRAGRRLCEEFGLAAALVKLDADGIVVIDRHTATQQHVPTRRRPVHDVTGAGDMVLAIVGLCQAAGWSLVETAELANIAAGLEVEKLGVSPVSWEEIHGELQGGRLASKIVTLQRMVNLADSYRRRGKTLVFTNGCFDLLHVGHVCYLQEAALLGDVLVVALNSDASVRRIKGAGRPVIGQTDRAAMLAALGCVDHVLIFDEDTPHQLLRRIRPDLLVKGGTTVEVVGREVLESYGGRVCVVGRVDGVSTTQIVSEIRQSTCAPPIVNA